MVAIAFLLGTQGVFDHQIIKCDRFLKLSPLPQGIMD